ncbi:MAG: NAD(P)/FAD-dependent oxidoreductase, partial [Anaerolineales bacterium]|nr:NAD(P)/FAD-dependent oxidoreductase [Anaerolineales bacterium]
QPVRGILRTAQNVRFLMGEVTGVDLAEQVVHTAVGESIAYDHLILSMGSTTNFFGTPGAAEHCYTLKSVEEGIELRNHMLRCVERATHTADPTARQRLLTFVVIGGGPTGVEYAGALAELLYHPLNKDFPDLNLRETSQVILVEAADGLLRGIGGGDYALERLQKKGVDVRLHTMVSGVDEHTVYFKDDTAVECAFSVWTAGVIGVDFPQPLDLPRVRGGRIPIEPTLTTAAHPNVYVIGDLAYLEQDGEALPGVAQVAMQMGDHTAVNILRHTRGEAPQPFRYNDKGSMATIGRNAAVANIGGRIYTGFLAWIIWLAIHLVFLIGFRNRLATLVNWAWNYFFYDRVVRLILPTTDTNTAVAPPPENQAAP